jgi:hypothetical protein
MVKIIAHQSLTLTGNGGGNPLGTKLIQHLNSRFLISPEGICSNAFYRRDMENTNSQNPGTRYDWYICDVRKKHQNEIMAPRDKEPVILLWGSGVWHFVSQYISLKNDKYHKVVWDRHYDDEKFDPQHAMNNFFPARTGLWLNFEGKYHQNCEDYVILNGKNPSCELQDQQIHGSVDLDVIRGFPAMFDWQFDKKEKQSGKESRLIDNRGITLDELTESLVSVLSKNNLRRFDLGGLHHPTEGGDLSLANHPQIVNPSESKEALDFAIACYERVLSIAYERMG